MLAAVVHRPLQRTEKLAILCPGYLDTKDYAHLAALAGTLAARGYTAVRFDPTGTWGSEGDISEYLTSQYLRDVGSVLEHMLRESAYSQVVVGGHSRGGQVAILYAARDPRVSCVLGIMPSHGPIFGSRRTDWESTGVSVSTRDIPGEEGRKEFRVPVAHMLDRDGFDALADIRKITAPIVLLAGEKDTVVPPEDVQELYEAANEPKRYVLVEGVAHDYRLAEDEIAAVHGRLLQALDSLVEY